MQRPTRHAALQLCGHGPGLLERGFGVDIAKRVECGIVGFND